MIHWFGEGSPDPSKLGGKATSLDRLVRLALPVPQGFCLTTDAYHRFLHVHGLTARIAELCAGLPEESARQSLAAFAHTYPVPDDVTTALQRGLGTLAARTPSPALLAVRSSAVGEDAATSSFAGAHESVLGVPAERVEAAIRSCWASLWSARAVAYRVRKQLGFTTAAMAVVVQELVPAEVSAVAFTKNPMSSRGDEILVNATWGLGEAIVSGTITPDTIILDKATLRVRSAQVGEKRWRVDIQEGGGTTTIPVTASGFALNEALLGALGELCQKVEDGFGAPVDIEAAYARGRWYLVQARPITTS